MPYTTLNIENFLAAAGPIVDVRSPGEFADGHIPGAFNVPLFDNEERAVVGTIYAKQGKNPAFFKGFELAGAKIQSLVADLESATQNQEFRLHCWRGGMRSQSMAWLVSHFGISPKLLSGGYKAYRRAAIEAFQSPLNLIVLSGLTGSGKTILLHRLKEAGEQIIDLEGLANHRGSAFGNIGLPPQPRTQQFENLLYEELRRLDTSRRIWIEDESQAIGKVRVPHELWRQMRDAPVLFVDVPHPVRVKVLIDEYGNLPKDELAFSISQITRRLGGERTKKALEALEAGNLDDVTKTTLEYYDSAYQKSASTREQKNGFLVRIDGPHGTTATQQLVQAADTIPSSQGKSMKEVINQLKKAATL